MSLTAVLSVSDSFTPASHRPVSLLWQQEAREVTTSLVQCHTPPRLNLHRLLCTSLSSSAFFLPTWVTSSVEEEA